MDVGAGLGAIAFWGFLAICVWAGIWDSIRRREAKHETLCRLIESGQPIDERIMDKLLGGTNDMDRDLKVGELVTLSVAPGLAIMAWFISQIAPQALLPMLGASILLAFIGGGLLLAAKAIEKASRDSGDASRGLGRT